MQSRSVYEVGVTSVWLTTIATLFAGFFVAAGFFDKVSSTNWILSFPAFLLLLSVLLLREYLVKSEFDWVANKATLYFSKRYKPYREVVYSAGDVLSIIWSETHVKVNYKNHHDIIYKPEYLRCNGSVTSEGLARELGCVFCVPANKIKFEADPVPA